MATVEQYLSVLAGAQAAQNAEAQRAAAQMQIELKSGDLRHAINVCMTLITRGQPLEARHFGYGVLQHAVHKRWREFSPEEQAQLSKLVYDKLSEVGAAPTDSPEPWMIKSKVATLMAEVVRQDGARLWTQLMPDMAMGAASDSPVLAELSCLVMRYVAEDVAVYNGDIIGGRMKELLGGLTSTLPQSLPALYRVLETHYSRAVSAVSAGDTARAKAHAAAVSAALSAAAVYGEWAPLAPLMRSGLMDACGHFLASSEFRSLACEVLRHVTHRRRGDAVNGAIASGAAADSAAALDEIEKEAAEDAAAVVSGITGMCRSFGQAAQHVLSAPPAESGTEEMEYIRRLTECMATLATNHITVVPDPALRSAFLEALLGLTRYPSLEVLGAAIPAWPGLLRGMGAELPGTFIRPDKSIGSGVWGAQQGVAGIAATAAASVASEAGINIKGNLLPEGAVGALLDASRAWLQQGAGVASGLATNGVPESKGDDWEAEFETRDELREAWVVLRARCMEVAKLCTTLEPCAATAAAANHLSTVLGWLGPGASLDATKACAGDGRSAIDDAIGAALEGAVSFIEPVMQAIPMNGGGTDQTKGVVTPALEAMLKQTLAVDLKSPVAVAQLARLLEALGRAALVHSDAATALLQRLFSLLAILPAEDPSMPPVRAKAAIAAGKTSQAARQRVCAAVLGICVAAPNVFNAHLEAFANQVEGLRSSGCLSGAERGALAEALLAVAGPSGPARVRDVLRWLLDPVQKRWLPSPGQLSADLLPLFSLMQLAKGEGAKGSLGLSDAHWELFHDVQLTERCLRRSGGDHESGQGEGGTSPGGSDWRLAVPAGMVRPVDPPPPTSECPASDHLEWTLMLATTLCNAIQRLWTPAGIAEATAAGLERALCMSPEEQASHLVHGPARTYVLAGGGLPLASPTVDATRDWLRGLRDSAYAIFTLLSVHAPASFYPSRQVAVAVAAAVYSELPHMHDRHVRQCLHMVIRPIVGRCPASHRGLWHAALTATLVPHMHERLAAGWERVKASAAGAIGAKAQTDLAASLGGGARGEGVNTGGGSAVVEDLIAERVTRDLTRDHCALLELIATPEGTFGRKTKGSGLTGHLRGVVGSSGDSDGGGGSPRGGANPTLERLAHGGGKHIRDWMAATSSVDVSGAVARAGVATATAAVTWGDSEAAGRALAFMKGVVACAASPECSDQALRETAGAEILPACLGGLTIPTNSAHQADLLGLVRDVVLHLLPVTQSVRSVLLGLPGMTQAGLDGVLSDLATIRSEKKAANRVKEMLVAAAGGGDALRAFAEARAGATSTGAIQVPNVSAARAAGAVKGGAGHWSEEDVNQIGLNPITASNRPRQ